jgi:hypothetical protein
MNLPVPRRGGWSALGPVHQWPLVPVNTTGATSLGLSASEWLPQCPFAEQNGRTREPKQFANELLFATKSVGGGELLRVAASC